MYFKLFDLCSSEILQYNIGNYLITLSLYCPANPANSHPLEVVSRYRDRQLQVAEKYSIFLIGAQIFDDDEIFLDVWTHI